jgi:hypothetical protein
MCGIGEFEGPLRVGYATCMMYEPVRIFVGEAVEQIVTIAPALI